MNQLKQPENGYQSRVRANVYAALPLERRVGCGHGVDGIRAEFLWNKALVFTLLAVGRDVAVGVGMILANKDYLAELMISSGGFK